LTNMAEVLTVRGPLAADQLGRTLPQEHLLIDLARVTRNFDHFLHDGSLATIEACRFRDAGGGTIVDLANRNLGGDPRGLSAIAEQTGLNIVMGCGWYREPYYDREVYEKSTNQLADDIVRDIVEGVDGTGIRAGTIGRGFLHRLLLSHDVCMLPHLHAFGGTGYDYLLTDFVERLCVAGLMQREIDTLLIDNPPAALAP